MIRAYSQRILPPYTGCVQLAESARARAQSFDGINWEIHYTYGVLGQAGHAQDRQQGYGLDRSYYHVANVQQRELKPFVVPACLDATDVTAAITELFDFLQGAEVPFPAADIYEYWLLDAIDEAPLALIFSCCEEGQMASFPAQTEWTALPSSKMKIENTTGEAARNAGPVNHRLQDLVRQRAGSKPRAAWFRRDSATADDFPALLVREDWPDVQQHDLCRRYIERKSPRLLMLQGLSHGERDRLEQAARQYATEVEAWYPLYPDVVDADRMSAIRVEARLRRQLPQRPGMRPQERPSEDTGMSKDMRIFET